MNRYESFNEQPDKQYIIPLEEWQLNNIAIQHLQNVNYHLPPKDGAEKTGADQIFYSNDAVWQEIINRTLRFGSYLKLENFLLLEWLPRCPGLYFTESGKEARRKAKRHIESVEDNTIIYDPYGKMSMLDGGIGNIRLKPINIDQEEHFLISASSNGICHEGFPVAVPKNLYERYIDRIIANGAVSCSLIGKLRFTQLSKLYDGSTIPQLYLLVEDVYPSNDTNINYQEENIEVTIAVSFIGEFDNRKDIFASYVTFFPTQKNSLRESTRWMEEEYIIGRYKGTIVTDFDQQQYNYPKALISLEKVMNRTLTKEDLEQVPFLRTSELIECQQRFLSEYQQRITIMGNQYNISGGNQGAVGDNPEAHDFVQNSSQTSQSNTSDESTQTESSTASPFSKNGNKKMDLSSLTRLFREKPWIFLVLVGLVTFLSLLVANNKIKIPGILEPNKSETESQAEVTVNLLCTWKSPSKLTKPIQSAAVTATSMRTGNSINVFGKGIDSDGRISFPMGRKDVVAVTIRHPDIRDSQIQIPNIKITESDSVLKESNYTVIRTNCFFDAK